MDFGDIEHAKNWQFQSVFLERWGENEASIFLEQGMLQASIIYDHRTKPEVRYEGNPAGGSS